MNLTNVLSKYLSDNRCKQISDIYYLKEFVRKNNDILLILDLGCGIGDSVMLFEKLFNNFKWYGIDIENSPEVNSRITKNDSIITYDGIHIPFQDNLFDIIYTHQVFEHVNYPLELLKEVNRVLKIGGCFIGSTSQLEPYHSYSLWNYTPFGFITLLESAGFNVKEVHASIDSFTLLFRRLIGSPSFMNICWRIESPFNLTINILRFLLRKNYKWANSIKLLFCGQFCFNAVKE